MSGFAFKRSNAWIFAVALGLAAFGSVDPSRAGSDASEPFRLATVALPEGPLTAKWQKVEAAITDDLALISQCRADRANCASPAALQFLKIVDQATAQTGLARIGEINRAFNLTIRAMSDQAQYGVEDLWTSPIATLTAGAGDCEDYAIAKLVALREAGISQDDLRFVILREPTSGEDHAVAAVRIDNRWRMLDNRHMMMLEDRDITKLDPVFAIDTEGAKRFVDPAVAMARAGKPVVVASAQADAGLRTSTIATEYVLASFDAYAM